MKRPLYDVHDSSGAELETESTEDSTIISEVTVEETTYSEDYTAMEESYLGGEVDEMSYEEISDFDAEDGDLSFADEAGDTYETGLDEEEEYGLEDEDEAGEDEEEEDEVEEEGELEDSGADEGDYEDDGAGAEEEDYEDDGGDEDYDDGGDEDYDDGGDDPESGTR